jgi:hypothetical protein
VVSEADLSPSVVGDTPLRSRLQATSPAAPFPVRDQSSSCAISWEVPQDSVR